MSGRDTVLKYCSQWSLASYEHIQNAIENKRLIEQERYSELNGCPSSYGLDEFVGLCEEENVSWKAQDDQCEMCWKKALGVGL